MKQKRDGLQKAYSYYRVRLDVGRDKKGGWREGAESQGMCAILTEPEYYSFHNKEPLKSFN